MDRNQNNQNNLQGKQQSSGRGFAGMDKSRQQEIASKGGSSVPAEKRSFSRDHSLAAEAGRKGGEARSSTTTRDEEDDNTGRSHQRAGQSSGSFRAANDDGTNRTR